MKKVSFLLMIVMSTLTINSFSQPKLKNNEGKNNVAYIDSKLILDSLPSYKEAVKQVEQKKSTYVEELKKMEKEISEKVAKFKESGEEITEDNLQIKQINKLQEFYKETESEYNDKLTKYQNSLLIPILEKVKKAITEVSEEKNLDVVFEMNNFVWIRTNTNITKEVLKKLTSK